MKNNALLASVRPVYTSGQVADKINFKQNLCETCAKTPCRAVTKRWMPENFPWLF